MKKQEVERVLNPLRKEFWHCSGHPAQKSSPILGQMAPRHQAAVTKTVLYELPTVKQFSLARDQKQLTSCLNLLASTGQRQSRRSSRLLPLAEKEAAGKGDVPTKRLPIFRAWVNTVTTYVENKKTHLVVIARDVDPAVLEVFLFPPCCKVGVLYCILKRKTSLELLVHRKVCATLAFTRGKTKVFWLNWRKLTGPITRDTIRIATTGKAIYWFPNL
ncbi:hypothetical protein U0070_014220 [Myodes glareolus]|uniref:60S ribosomal protein L7a n=1 Tax=Myodes glareolus TaxID=447135 RepID=A0AAW0INQ0_MYOGA